MNITAPHYFPRFHCTADQCPDTCCRGWEIGIDPASLKKYRRLKGPIGSRLANSVDWKKGIFKSYQGSCPMLSDEGLCDLYIEAGPEYLCRTCRLYPRHIEEFQDSREVSLSMSCIEAAKIILGCSEKTRFITRERRGEDRDFEDFDFLLYTKLTDARDLAFQILQNRREPLKIRTAMALSLAHDLQRRLDRGRQYEIDDLLKRYGAEGAFLRFKKRLEDVCISHGQGRAEALSLLGGLEEMEVLNSSWPEYLSRILQGAGQKEAGGSLENWEIWGEQIMVYFVYTYFCGAVYDGRAFGRMKFAAAGLVIIRMIFDGLLALGEDLSLETAADGAHRYSREIEHSDKNKAHLLDLLDQEYPLMRLLPMIMDTV